MPSIIKVSDKTKRQIERLQATLLLTRERKLTQLELIERIVDKFLVNPDMMNDLFETDKNREEKIKECIARTKKPLDWGIEDASSTIDETIGRA